MILKRMLKG